MINQDMLKNLNVSLKSLKDAQKMQDTLVNGLIEQLPDDKKEEAVKLMADARKGKVDPARMMTFANGVRDINKEEFEKNVKDAVENLDKKKAEAEAKAAAVKPEKEEPTE